MVSMITRIKYKERAGEPLTEEERQFRHDYQKKFTKAQMCIYVRRETQARWTEIASSQGVTMSQWMVGQVAASLEPSPQLAALQQENHSQRDEIETLKRLASEALAKAAETEGKLRSVEADLADALRAQVRHLRGQP